MALWRDHVLPRLVHRAMSNDELVPLRRQTAAGLHGMVLELGFGSGLNLPFLPQAVTRLQAVDPALVGRKLAADNLADSPVPVDFVGLDGQQLPLADHSIDAALSTWTLCTIPDMDAALAELRRVLKPGGRLHFAEHGLHPDEKVAHWQQRLNPVQKFCCGGCHLDRPMDVLIERAGFTLESLENTVLSKGPKVATYQYVGVARAGGP